MITYIISEANRRVVLTDKGFCRAMPFDWLEMMAALGWPERLFDCEGERLACMVAWDEVQERGLVEGGR